MTSVFMRISPFKLYMRAGSWAFGGTIIANFVGSSFDYRAPISFIENPQQYTIGVVCKGLYYGAFWPAIPMAMFNNPRGYFVLGSGIEEAWKIKEWFNNGPSDVFK